MKQQIFINLPVRDLDKSKAFYVSLGFTINQQFSDETGACVVISDTIFVMLLTHDKFKQFTPKEIADAHKTTEVLNALSVASKERVDELMELALNNGGTPNGQTQEYDFMYGRDFNDPDGHIWELFYMDMEKLPK
ncbi:MULTISPECIES: VOC family protein [Aequorivita]|uniref:VOC family protein n=1 Tax=Aequorivita iocasae TaxID=2803865 RepID=A0ABX7DQ80_9FLAO|nr:MULTISPECIES: VOC family protein [Aequorivita]QQX75972.1 VOC family protein [Aequorivita iocasae]UCA55433.1 VOC family protein [Aequorivita sp. F7]